MKSSQFGQPPKTGTPSIVPAQHQFFGSASASRALRTTGFGTGGGVSSANIAPSQFGSNIIKAPTLKRHSSEPFPTGGQMHHRALKLPKLEHGNAFSSSSGFGT